jgi:hypothetical protein
LRIRDEKTTWRIMYHVHTEAVVILEVFPKKTGKTPQKIITMCKVRLRRFRAAMKKASMDAKTRKKLEKAGWTVGNAEGFLGLSPEEVAFLDMKLALVRGLRETRRDRNLTQTQVAAMIGSSQSRIAKMEGADPTVSVDLLLRALLALGVKRAHLAAIIAAESQNGRNRAVAAGERSRFHLP